MVVYSSETQPTRDMSGFWNRDYFDFDDPLNQEIWSRSPVVQQEIQSPRELQKPGAIGAQQAMIDLTPNPRFSASPSLPWVPDVVGKEWHTREALLIVGSAYAGFIREFSTRSRALPLADYVSASSASQFQRSFLRYVVAPDSSYYGPIQALASSKTAARIALFDVCRASFVKRGSGTAQRNDTSGDSVALEAPEVFEQYAENKTQADWTWRRITESQANRIVALGYIAEHGLLRLFARHGMQIQVSNGSAPPLRINAFPDGSGRWVKVYADHPSRPVGSWLKLRCWWTISGEVEGVHRAWHLLPAFHPARHQKPDPEYRQTKVLLAAMKT